MGSPRKVNEDHDERLRVAGLAVITAREKLAAAIVAALEAGYPVRRIASLVGLSHETVRRTMIDAGYTYGYVKKETTK